MHRFTYYTPTKVIFGKDSEQQVGDLIAQAGKHKALVLFGGGSVQRSGLLNRVTAALQQAGVAFATLGGVQPNPLLSFAEKAVQFAKDEQVDFVLAVGGGSVIDTAKAVAIGVANPAHPLWSFFLQENSPQAALPVGVVLTIAAAGSETSDSCVLTKDEGEIKRGLGTAFNRPLFAVMNPELTYSLPTYQIACGVTDIMMHTLDRYFTTKIGNEITDQIAEALLRTTIHFGAIQVKDAQNYEAASEVMWCGSLSHNDLTGLGGLKDFSTHQLGHELSGKYNVAHGASLSAMWGAWAHYVYASNPSRFARYARNVWAVTESDDRKAAEIGIKKTVAFFHEIGMPTSIGELKVGAIGETELQELTEKCTHFGKREIGQFQKLKRQDIYNVYQSAL